MNILVTGGAGYLGTHTIVELVKKGHKVSILDNLSNSNPKSIDAVERLVGSLEKLYITDLRSSEELDYIFTDNNFDAVIHFAAKKYVGESVENPLLYFDNNISGIVNLLHAMKEHGVKKIIFSSSSTVYGDSDAVPFKESQPRGVPTNPYGRTKFMCEDILTDLCYSDPEWEVILLRYFNPIGAHPSGEIGEAAGALPPNIMPYIIKVAQGKLPQLNIFGGDYDTIDGTGVRDYIHVCDLADAHVAALNALVKGDRYPKVYNVGTGHGVSVLNLVKVFSDVTGVEVPYQIVGRRDGDVAISYCDVTKIHEELGWWATRDIQDMCKDAWNWAVKHPNGYED